MDIDELPRETRMKVFSEVMRAAREMGFAGFGGSCWSAAVAINRLLFSSRAGYTMAVNEALHAAGCTVGHVAVTIEDAIHLDVDGRPKVDEEIESWGMLDPQDDDWQERAAEFGVEWGDAAAEGAKLLQVSEQELLGYAEPGVLERQLQILERAIARVQSSVSASSSPGMR